MDSASHEITQLLDEVGHGNKSAEARLLPLLYKELHRLAEIRLAGEQNAPSLRPTELVNEAYIRLLANVDKTWQNRSHFYATAARAMRNIVVDYIRSRHAEKRGGQMVRIEYNDQLAIDQKRYEEVLTVHAALDRLEQMDPQQARIVELRYFGGFTMAEIAELMDVPQRSVEREWEYARNWLYSELTKAVPHGSRTVASH